MSDSTSVLRISPKRLGLILLLTFCPACFWFKLRLRFRMPFDMFGGAIFRQLEQAEMAIFGHLLGQKGGLPKEFGPFRDIDGRVEFPRDWRKFQYSPQSNVVLYGEPDEIVSLSSGGIAVLDHKTARPKDGDDPLLPMYRCQTMGYGMIAEGLKLGTVRKAGLLYWTALQNDVIENPEKHYRGSQLWVPFAPTPIAFDVDFSVLEDPLKEAIRLWKAKTPPEHAERCPDAKRLEALFALQATVENELNDRDRAIYAGAANKSWAQFQVMTRIYFRDQARRQALADICGGSDGSQFAADGMVANWAEDWEFRTASA